MDQIADNLIFGFSTLLGWQPILIIIGGVIIGIMVDIDERDHVFVVHRDQAEMFSMNTEIGLFAGVAECCTPAPPILEFDIDGNLVNAWGGAQEDAEYVWPASNEIGRAHV